MSELCVVVGVTLLVPGVSVAVAPVGGGGLGRRPAREEVPRLPPLLRPSLRLASLADLNQQQTINNTINQLCKQ